MKSISLYIAKETWLTRLHPFTKLFYVLMAVALPWIAGHILFFPVMMGISIVLLISGGLFKKALPLIVFSFTVLLTIFLVQGLFYQKNETILFSLGKATFYEEGIRYALGIGCNILNMLLSFALFVLSTNPFTLAEELERAGLHRKAGYILISVFQIIPGMLHIKNTILDAQRSRGMETKGNILIRAKAFLPLISPVVTSSLIHTRERAAALEIRGFESAAAKTFLTDRPQGTADRICLLCLAGGLLAAVLWRVLG